MKVLVKTANMTREEWLKWRTAGIGGSDVSIIAGINKFKSVFQLWLEKTGQIVPKETESEYAHFGTMLEPIVKREFTKRTGLKIRSKKAILQSVEYPFMLADLDGEMVIFEAKTASAYKQEVWENGVPPEYILQVQHYMVVTGARKAYIAALVGGNHFYYHEVLRDEDLILQIIAMEKEFWEDSVLLHQEPVADGSDATTTFLNEKYRCSNGKEIELPEEVLLLCDSYEKLSLQLKMLKEKKEAVSNQLKLHMKDYEIGKVGSRTITWKPITTTAFDKGRLAKENKDIYDKYCTQSQYRRLLVA